MRLTFSRKSTLRLGLAAAALAVLAVALAQAWRLADDAAADRAGGHLLALADQGGQRFEPAMVASLPEPARRYFTFAIRPGARLGKVVELTMGGDLSLGTREDPAWRPMQARQVLAAPHGLLWQVRLGHGIGQLSGSDGMDAGRSWTRFWLARTLPVARAGGDADHLRSSFGRVVAEAVFWSPAALLPRPGVQWDAVDADTARVTVTEGSLRQEVTVRVEASGQPLWVSLQRWSNANADGVFRLQPFGGTLSDFREVQGYRVPFRVDAGNFFGTDAYFPFYRARVQAFRVIQVNAAPSSPP